MNKIGDYIKILRKESGLSIRVLAEKIGISPNTLTVYERNIAIPTVPNALKVAEYFKVPMEFLVYRKVITKPEFWDNELLALVKEIDSLEDNKTIKLARIIL